MVKRVSAARGSDMSIGISGASGSGKSTLAKAFALKESWLFVPSPAQACFQELGLPFVGLSFEDRLRVQDLILTRFDQALTECRNELWITDRTPIDMMAFMLAEWGQRCDAAQGEMLIKYMDRCFEVLNRHFTMIMMVPPGIPYVDDGSRPAENKAFVMVQSLLIEQLMREIRTMPWAVQIVPGVHDLEVRVATVAVFWRKNIERAVAMREEALVH